MRLGFLGSCSRTIGDVGLGVLEIRAFQGDLHAECCILDQEQHFGDSSTAIREHHDRRHNAISFVDECKKQGGKALVVLDVRRA